MLWQSAIATPPNDEPSVTMKQEAQKYAETFASQNKVNAEFKLFAENLLTAYQVRGARLPTSGARLPTYGADLPTCGARLPTCGSRLPTAGARLLTSGARLLTGGSTSRTRARTPSSTSTSMLTL